MKIALAVLLLAELTFQQRWDGDSGRSPVQEREAVEVVKRVAPPSHYRPQDKPKRRAERVSRRHHQRVSRFKCHRVYVSKHRWHCQRRG